MMTILWLLPLTLALSWGLTALMRRYALSRSLLDVPNARSSHVIPTPRGGGMAIVASFLLALAATAFVLPGTDRGLLAALLGAGAGVALLGFLDGYDKSAAPTLTIAMPAGSANEVAARSAGRDFANAVALVESGLEPPAMLARLKGIERDFGRRASRRWGPRVLDLDIALWSGGRFPVGSVGASQRAARSWAPAEATDNRSDCPLCWVIRPGQAGTWQLYQPSGLRSRTVCRRTPRRPDRSWPRRGSRR